MNAPRVALLWHGNREARDTARLEDVRLRAVAEALAREGVVPEPAVYHDEFVDEVRAQLLQADGVLVWVNPLEQGRDRSLLDAMLAQVAGTGVLVSAHPRVILAMGTKEVLYRTRSMGWGCDTHRYASPGELRAQLPRRLAGGGARVLKRNRGNGGDGVWKVERHPGAGNDAVVRVRHARRGSVEEVLPLEAFLARCDAYFGGGGRIIDQAWQERLAEGMVRCYLVRERVAGFGHQRVNALFPAPPGVPPEDAPQPGPRLYHPPTRPEFARLKAQLEREWVPDMCRLLGLDPGELPVIWDADFLYGPQTAHGHDSYVLCEINVSSVYPFPDSALAPLARETAARLQSRHEPAG